MFVHYFIALTCISIDCYFILCIGEKKKNYLKIYRKLRPMYNFRFNISLIECGKGNLTVQYRINNNYSSVMEYLYVLCL